MLENAIKTLRTLLPDEPGSVTPAEIITQVDRVRVLYPAVDRDALIQAVTELYNIRADPWTILEGRERRMPWLTARRTAIQWSYWIRYRDYLQIEKNYAPDTLYELNRLTDTVLDKLFDPNISQGVTKLGMVVGQVQSGKTSNYTGLICKAVDAGYKIIVVLAGIHNSLRSQTQLRLDEGFLGRDTQIERRGNNARGQFGVGYTPGLVAHSITSSRQNGDFTTGAFNSLGIAFETNEPILLVVKKNANVLSRLNQWLSAQTDTEYEGTSRISSKALLLIDDEADHASINTNQDFQQATRINREVREILGRFMKGAYVGYTATPFANLFIALDEDQLFPRDFIVNLPPPNNYIGPERTFGFRLLGENETSETVLPMVRRVTDHIQFAIQAQDRNAPLPDALPESLWLAIRSFILVCAIRQLRGQVNVHNSMLIHVSRYIARQAQIKGLVEEVFTYYRQGIEQNSSIVLEELRQTFEIDSIGYESFSTTSQIILNSPPLRQIDSATRVHTWNEVQAFLHPAADRIRVKEINGGSADVLGYFDEREGLSVIAVGGDKLSRGLTLEGLSVSYYLRVSSNYDTLMQMGRWFGYRPGYVDLCRLFTSRDLNEWFCHITLASEELRDEFEYMANVAAGTPLDYALKVRTHPGGLQITAANRLRRAVPIRVSYAGRLVETYEFQKNLDVIRTNYQNTRQFIATMGAPMNNEDKSTHQGAGHCIWQGVGPDAVIRFLEGYRTTENLRRADSQSLIRYINLQAPSELVNWTVALMSGQGSAKRADYDVNGQTQSVGLYLRNQEDNNSDEYKYYVKRSHLISPRHESIDLTTDQYTRAMERTRVIRIQRNKTGEADYPTGEVIRGEIRPSTNALLLIYSLDPSGAEIEPYTGIPIVGYAISFPGSNFDRAVDYVVHGDLIDVHRAQEADRMNEEETEDVNDDDA